jgi:hypothetical protein
MNRLNTLSEQLLLAVKKEEPYEDLLDALADFQTQEVENQLINDSYKNAFWINIYNSFFQILRKDKGLRQPKIYTEKRISIAGYQISLDDIEHGILRRYRYKYSLGYLPNLFASSHIKKWAVDAIDFRIHFALNCGAVSCPPIAFYSVANLEEQLELASLAFLRDETQIDTKKKKIHVSRLFLWFFNDFKGAKGTRKIVSKYLDQDFSGYKLVYNDYSWEEYLDNYAENRFDS